MFQSKHKKILLIIFVILLLLGVGYIFFNKASNNTQSVNNDINVVEDSQAIVVPISQALERITKKPFGIYITPASSPVEPEKFTGYHTGVDFETLPAEQDLAVPIFAVCSGPLLSKSYISGYGGVIVQSCQLDNQPVTVVYGHLKLSSVTSKVGQELTVKDQIAVLGQGYSQETDNERKHLHLGIHKGSMVNIKGYVQTKTELSAWLDPVKALSL